MREAKLVSVEKRDDLGKYSKGHGGGPGRGHVGPSNNERATRRRALTRAWQAKTRLLRAAMALDGDQSFETVLRTFATDEPIEYVKWVVAELTPSFPVEHAGPDAELIGVSSEVSPQILIDQLTAARMASEAVTQPTISIPEQTPERPITPVAGPITPAQVR